MKKKKATGYKAERGDIKWDNKCTTLYPSICFACGIAAGALGIAAGMILSPILLELGMIPAVAAATSGFAVLFTSSCTRYHRIICRCMIDSLKVIIFFSLQFLVLGHLSPSYGIAYVSRKFHLALPL